MTEIEAIILGSFIGGTIGIAGNYLGYRLSRTLSLKNIRMSEFYRAAAKLRAAFAPALVKLSLPRELGNQSVREFFDREFLIHAAAIEEFRPFVDNNIAYQAAWNDYREIIYDDNALGDVDLSWSSGLIISDDGTENLDFLRVIMTKIEQILSFASPEKRMI